MKDFVFGACLGLIAVGVGITLMAWVLEDDIDAQCKTRFFQMQSVMRCQEAYPRCEVTAEDFETARWNLDYYERNCYEFEQKRPKPQPKPKAEKQSFKI